MSSHGRAERRRSSRSSLLALSFSPQYDHFVLRGMAYSSSHSVRAPSRFRENPELESSHLFRKIVPVRPLINSICFKSIHRHILTAPSVTTNLGRQVMSIQETHSSGCLLSSFATTLLSGCVLHMEIKFELNDGCPEMLPQVLLGHIK